MKRSTLGNPKTASETLFEEYLTANGYTDWTNEQPTLGKPTTPDYRVRFGGVDLYFEVKEFENNDPVQDGAYSPYRPLREKVNQAARQFKCYKEFPCSLVLSDPHAAGVDIDAPEIIIGTMLGNIGFVIPFGDSADPDAAPTQVLTRGGKMAFKHGTAWNTTFSSIICLTAYPLRRKQILIALDKRNREAGRKLTHEESWATAKAIPTSGGEDTVLRVVVYENPYARIPLSRDLFRGAFDERWGTDGDSTSRVFVGDRLAALETELAQCDLRSPRQRLIDQQRKE